MDSTAPAIVLLRRDLRLADNPALHEAAQSGAPLMFLYPWDEQAQDEFAPGPVARAWYLVNALSLAASLQQQYGSRLVIRRGRTVDVLLQLIAETGAGSVHLNAGHDPPALAEELAISSACRERGVSCLIHAANMLLPTGAVLSAQGKPMRVFTPFYRRFLQRYRHSPPLPAPASLNTLATLPAGDDPAQLLLSQPAAAQAVAAHWEPGEAAALACMRRFIRGALEYYGSDRHSLEISGTSRISAWLQAGVVSTRQLWEMVEAARARDPRFAEGAESFLRQLIWREFCCNVLDDFPGLPTQPLQEKFAAFPWQEDPAQLQAWQEGRTGYPAVDAAMRQLRREGWMPGRARMIVGSFLVKHLLQPWQHGEAWFRDWLIDYDLSCNAFNWQWIGGCGADAAPYFRIFNPILQGRKFDADGSYVREWLPELAGLPDKVLHSPWEASPLELAAAGIRLGSDYPRPLVEHGFARERAMAALKSTA